MKTAHVFKGFLQNPWYFHMGFAKETPVFSQNIPKP